MELVSAVCCCIEGVVVTVVGCVGYAAAVVGVVVAEEVGVGTWVGAPG